MKKNFQKIVGVLAFEIIVQQLVYSLFISLVTILEKMRGYSAKIQIVLSNVSTEFKLFLYGKKNGTFVIWASFGTGSQK